MAGVSICERGEAEVPMKSYREFIKEVFIDPIRTAVVVDDEFPTLDGFISDPASEIKKAQINNAKAIIDLCREQRPHPWVVDVHDGKNISLQNAGNAATHFDHTDLLILDYHLEGEHKDGGKAIGILSRLARNEHFNQVIVYTNNDVGDTLIEIGLGLISYEQVTAAVNGIDMTQIMKNLGSLEESVPEDVAQALKSIDDLTILKLLSVGTFKTRTLKNLQELAYFFSVCDTLLLHQKFSPGDLVAYIVLKRIELLRGVMSKDFIGNVAIGFDGESNWIRTNSLFVTILSKTVPPSEFKDRLATAIAKWDPSPHQLILSKMRNEISSRGIIAENEVLQDGYLQAGWLDEIFHPVEAVRKTNTRRNVAMHWESIGSRIESNVLGFAEKIGHYLSENNIQISKFDKTNALSEKDKVALHKNAYVCCKEVEGYHLTSGHVFQIKNNQDNEYWVCVTPACDLVPGQGEELGAWKSFKAVRLYKLSDPKSALENAHRAHYLFLRVNGGDPLAFSFRPEAEGAQKSTPTMIWQQFYAKNQGNLFGENCNRLEILISQLDSGVVKLIEKDVDIVSQIRYEYALNLLQRLGSHLSRVGLDFVSPASINKKS